VEAHVAHVTEAVWNAFEGRRSVRASRLERTRPLPGDALIPEPADTLTHAITIGCGPSAIWPWLIQMGAGRAGWYSYDLLDNGRRPSASRLVPELQDLAIGRVFPALPGVIDGFVVLAFGTGRWLLLGFPDRKGTLQVTWAFLLDEQPDGSTRLIVRVRAAPGYRFPGLPSWMAKPAIALVHFVMQRKQLLGIAQRAEASCVTWAAPAGWPLPAGGPGQ
jgi:hypothetical protein